MLGKGIPSSPGKEYPTSGSTISIDSYCTGCGFAQVPRATEDCPAYIAHAVRYAQL